MAEVGKILRVAKKENVDIWLTADTFNTLAVKSTVTVDEEGNLRLEYDGYVIRLTLKSTLVFDDCKTTSIKVKEIKYNEKILYTCKNISEAKKTAEIV